MECYRVRLEGLNPLLLHTDNLAFKAKVEAWQKDPANSNAQVKGDDRAPAWTWLASVAHDGRHFGVPADNLMSMLREGGAKVVIRGNKTYKQETQSGLMIDQAQWSLIVPKGPDEGRIPIAGFQQLIGVNDFARHVEAAEALGFELLVKRAKVGQSKHVRVRPMFRQWTLEGSLTVIDAETSGITQPILQTILNQAGALCGIGDWRPSSPRKSGSFGKFAPTIELAT